MSYGRTWQKTSVHRAHAARHRMANGYPLRSGNFSAMSVSEQRTTTRVPFQRTLGLFVLGVL